METLNLGDIIEIQQIKSILKPAENLYKMFMLILKVANKKIDNDNITDIIDDADSEYTDSESNYSVG